MFQNKPLIIILGAGSFGTAIGNLLSNNDNIAVQLLTTEKDAETNINNIHRNTKYFPNIQLNKLLRATVDQEILTMADVVLIAIPSSVVIQYVNTLKPYINDRALLINCSKGFGEDDHIISEYLDGNFPNPVAALKGPSFSIEVINNMPTGFTFASRDFHSFETFFKYTANTNMKLDYTDDIIGTEILSIMKNVYTITMGIVDAHLDCINTRFLVFTDIVNEMRKALTIFGGRDETIFKYCGIGDFGLTSLNDLSRNRAMGLFIGKGFIKDAVSNNVTLEGQHSLNIFYDKLRLYNNGTSYNEFPILFELYRLMNSPEYDRRTFIYNIINRNRQYKTQ